MRVVEPRAFDFAALADGVVRNNVGVAAIRVLLTADVQGDELVVRPTGQRFPRSGAAPDGERGWWQVLQPTEPARTSLTPSAPLFVPGLPGVPAPDSGTASDAPRAAPAQHPQPR